MRTREYLILTVSLLVSATITVVAGCGGIKMDSISPNQPVAYVNADGTGESMTVDTLVNPYPHLKMADGQISLNDRCPVRLARLNRRLPAIYVNEKPIGFC